MSPVEPRRRAAGRTGARLAPAVLAALVLGACSTGAALRESEQMAAGGAPEPALQRLREARDAHPEDLRIQTALHRQTANLATQYLKEANDAVEAGDEAAAAERLRTVLEYDPGNQAARQTLRRLESRTQLRSLLADAARLAQGEPGAALRQVQKVLEEDPGWPIALRMRDDLLRRIAESRTLAPALDDKAHRVVSLNYRSTSLMTIFDTISRLSGVNFIFDNEVSRTATASIFAAKTTAEDAIKLLLASNQLREKVLNHNTVLIYPARLAKDREYRDIAVKTFFLNHASAKAVSSALKTIMKSKDLYVDERMNAVVMRDAPATIALAERLVLALDRPEAEVTLDVQVLEVQSKDLKEVGIKYPQSIGIGIDAKGDDGAKDNGTRLPLGMLGALSKNNMYLNLGQTEIALRLLQQADDTRMLANPKIRVKNGRKAIVDVGERIPVLTTVTTDIGSSGKVDYQDVGVKFEAVPTVSLDGEISIDISLSVSSLGAPQESRDGFKYYSENKRQAKTVLSARNNETRILAGLIKRNETASSEGLPWLSRIPGLGKAFGTSHDEKRSTEIVLVITPHIERNLDLPGAHVSTFIAGTEARTGPGLRLRSTGHVSVGTGHAPGQPSVRALAQAERLPPLPSLGVTGSDAAPAPDGWRAALDSDQSTPELDEHDVDETQTGGAAEQPALAPRPATVPTMPGSPGTADTSGSSETSEISRSSGSSESSGTRLSSEALNSDSPGGGQASRPVTDGKPVRLVGAARAGKDGWP